MATKQRTKKLPEDKRAKAEEEVQDEPRSFDDRPTHLAEAVLDSYQEQTGHIVGATFQRATIAGGGCYRPRATCINGNKSRSRWRVQYYVEWDDAETGLHRYSPKPSAVVWVDEAGKITDFCKA